MGRDLEKRGSEEQEEGMRREGASTLNPGLHDSIN